MKISGHFSFSLLLSLWINNTQESFWMDFQKLFWKKLSINGAKKEVRKKKHSSVTCSGRLCLMSRLLKTGVSLLSEQILMLLLHWQKPCWSRGGAVSAQIPPGVALAPCVCTDPFTSFLVLSNLSATLARTDRAVCLGTGHLPTSCFSSGILLSFISVCPLGPVVLDSPLAALPLLLADQHPGRLKTCGHATSGKLSRRSVPALAAVGI